MNRCGFRIFKVMDTEAGNVLAPLYGGPVFQTEEEAHQYMETAKLFNVYFVLSAYEAEVDATGKDDPKAIIKELRKCLNDEHRSADDRAHEAKNIIENYYANLKDE